MTQQDTKHTAPASAPAPAPRHNKFAAACVAGGVLLAAAGYGVYWTTTLQFREVTEDAYVEGNLVQVTTQIAGTVTAIAADNTDRVGAGQELVRLNDVDARLALERSEAMLAKTVRQVRAQYASASQMEANVDLRRAEVSKVQADFDRRSQLVKSGAISGEDLEHAREAVRTAQAALASAQQQFAANHALVDSTAVATHPDVMGAAAQLKDAYIATARTSVPAPIAGMVARRNVQVGQRVAAGTALMAVVPIDTVWVTANFKESQLRHLRSGQPVELTADAYGKDVVYHGKVVGEEAGTGSAFSLMPAQNATGNWIKVVQRVPVRIALDPREVARHPLQLGLSMRASVDTHKRGWPRLTSGLATRQSYRTEVFADEGRAADKLVASIIAANAAAKRAGNETLARK
ncbi:efflux RND transporter periplasmic adaptor subunit [Massilia sp. LXY-6]|uniref:HlyD family secretion protein n=1 Tax=Massilia sp. LXY-6 TaxID=3379823 RepID=UPI003EE2FDC4